jgi:DNA-binding NarL/FixJ family response regulator
MPDGNFSTNRATFVVEDIQVIRDELEPTMVELAGAILVGFADNEADAVAWFLDASHRWDDAVIDLFYAHGTGLGVLTAVQERRPGQRAIVLTNYCTDAMKARCSALGADAIFDKSTQLDEFFNYLKQDVR